jgi:hypothetical protein
VDDKQEQEEGVVVVDHDDDDDDDDDDGGGGAVDDQVMAFVFFFEIGLGPIPWLIVAEMFDNKYVATAMSVSSQVNWACNFLVRDTHARAVVITIIIAMICCLHHQPRHQRPSPSPSSWNAVFGCRWGSASRS